MCSTLDYRPLGSRSLYVVSEAAPSAEIRTCVVAGRLPTETLVFSQQATRTISLTFVSKPRERAWSPTVAQSGRHERHVVIGTLRREAEDRAGLRRCDLPGRFDLVCHGMQRGSIGSLVTSHIRQIQSITIAYCRFLAYNERQEETHGRVGLPCTGCDRFCSAF